MKASHHNGLKEESGIWVSHAIPVCVKNKCVFRAYDQRILSRPGIVLFASAWLLIPVLSLTLKLFVFVMCFDMVVKILIGWQSFRASLYILATVKQMCLKCSYIPGYCLFCFSHECFLLFLEYLCSLHVVQSMFSPGLSLLWASN